MAYVPRRLGDEEEAYAAPGAAAPVSPEQQNAFTQAAQAQQGLAQPQAAVAPQQTPGGPARKTPSSFLSFDRLLKANKGEATQGANALTNQLGAEGANAEGKIKGAWDDWNTAAAQGFTPAVNNNGDVSSSYRGPASLMDPDLVGSNFGSTLNQTNQRLQSLGSNAGIQAVSGGSGLDASLYGAVGRQRFKKLQEQYGGLDKLLADEKAQTAGKLEQYKIAAEAPLRGQVQDARNQYAAGMAAGRKRLVEQYGDYEKNKWLKDEGISEELFNKMEVEDLQKALSPDQRALRGLTFSHDNNWVNRMRLKYGVA